MDVKELLETVKDMKGHVEAHDQVSLRTDAAACCAATAELLESAAGRARGPAAAAAEHAKLDAAVLDLRAAVAGLHTQGVTLPGGFDPQTLLTIVELIAKIVNVWKHHGS